MRKCYLCEEQFETRKQRRLHVSNEHKGLICDNCKREFKNIGAFARHIKHCSYTDVILNEIRQFYCDGLSQSDILNKGYTLKAIKVALRHQRRNMSDAIKLARKTKKDSFIPSKSTKQKISKTLRQFYIDNPDKLPYKLRNSKNKSYVEEMFVDELKKRHLSGWKHRHQYGIYEYDIAFVQEKIDIEIDGHTHNIKCVIEKDKRRDEWSKSKGWRVIRFNAREVQQNVGWCVDIVQKLIQESTGTLL